MSCSREQTMQRRDYGRSSPLDCMAAEVQDATVARAAQFGVTLRDLRDWLAKEHGIKTSTPALCEWFKRRKAQAAQKPVPMEIEVSAPGAAEIRVRISALDQVVDAVRRDHKGNLRAYFEEIDARSEREQSEGGPR